MNETLPEPPALDPAALAATGFGRVRKGFEPTEVHATLGRAADALRAWALRDRQLSEQIAELEAELADARRVDESRLTAVLGEETARIIAAARDAATEIRTKAEEHAARLIQEAADEAAASADALRGEAEALRDEASRVRDEAVSEATRVRSDAEAAALALETEAGDRHRELLAEAEAVLGERTAEAEAAAAQILERATTELETARVEAAAARASADEEASSTREAARDEGRSMIAEAKVVRERILRDLVERRATARRQIEGARAGRDRIVELLRESVGEATAAIEGLAEADVLAGAAAVDAAEALAVETEVEVAELLVELGEDPAAAEPSPDAAEPGAAAAGAAESQAAEPESVAPESAEPEATESAQPEAAQAESAGVAAAPVEEEPSTDDAVEADGAADAEHDPASEPEPASGAAADDEADDESVEDGAGVDDDGPDATVHDLFARIRAEGLDDGPQDDAEDLEAVAGGGATGPAGSTADPSEAAVVTVLPNGAAGASEPETGASEPEAGSATEGLGTNGELLDRRDELLGPVEKGLSRALRRVASDEQNELLDQLRRLKRGRPDAAELLSSDAASMERFVEALTPEFARAADAGSAFWEEVAGAASGALFGDDDRLRERLESCVGSFLDLHRAHLERTFADAESEAVEPSELADRIRAAYRDWRSGSLADLAGDLATAGFAYGERRAAGPGTPWRWVVDHGGLPCADGEDNALAGAVPCEEPFPTGDLTPPAHPGCRCILAPAHQ